MALGFGGTSVGGFAFLNNMLPREGGYTGMLYAANIAEFAKSAGGIFPAMAVYMQLHLIFFGALHLTAFALCTFFYIRWRKLHPEDFQALKQDTQRNSVLMAPILTAGMAFNVFLVLGYVFIDWMRINVHLLLPTASVVYTLLWLWTIITAVRLQAGAMRHGFDVDNMHFGWLLIPFALAMTTVTGTGISYLASGGLADYVFLLSITSFTMTLFLTLVKVFSLFKSHYSGGLPEQVQFLPSFFVVVPIITLLSISMLRYGYYLQHKYHVPLPQALFTLTVCFGLGLMTWYLILGLTLLKDYFRDYLCNSSYFDESQWGLICPMVAYGVLTTFAYKHGMAHGAMMALTLIFMVLDVFVLTCLIIRQYRKLQGKIGATPDTQSS